MKANNKELVKKTAIITIGNVSTKLINFLLLPFYTYILSKEEYGTYDFLHSYIFLLIPVIGFQMDQAVFKYLVESRTNPGNQKSLVTTTTLFMLMQVLCYAVLFGIIGLFWKYTYLPFMAVVMMSTVVLYDTQQMVRGINKIGLYATAGVISSTINILCNIILLTKFNMHVDGLFLSSIISTTVAVVFLWASSGLAKLIDIKAFSVVNLKKELSFGIPLVPNEIAWWIIHASDRTIVTVILSMASNGIIAVSQKFSSAYIMVYNIFNLSWTESVILHYKDKGGEKYISDTLNSVTALFSSCALGIVAVMPFMFHILVKGDYGSAYYLIPLYMIAGVVDVYLGMLSAVFVAQSKTKYIASTTMLAGIINIIVHLALIYFIGIYAAPISTVFGYATILVVRYLRIKKETEIRFNLKGILMQAVLFAVTMIVYYIRNPYLCGLILIADLVICIYMNKIILLSCKSMVMGKLKKART